MDNLEQRVQEAVRHFWKTRKRQAKDQGRSSGKKDHGTRRAVTGGKQIDGFIALMADLLEESGLSKNTIFLDKKSVVLPGWYRPTKEWDLIVVVDGKLMAIVEFKSQVGSFGNNFNNRTEEAIGNAVDVLAAYREGAFAGSARPWRGYFMLLEDAPKSTNPVAVKEPHFLVFPEFRESSYADRYRILCMKLVRENLYDAACLLMSDKKDGIKGRYKELDQEIGFRSFAASLVGRASAVAKMRNISMDLGTPSKKQR